MAWIQPNISDAPAQMISEDIWKGSEKMGIYNTYGELCGQLKIGSCELKHFDVGDTVDILDGVYLTYANVVVIKDGIFIAEFNQLMDKWGGCWMPGEIIAEENPIAIAIESIKKEDDDEALEICV